MSKNSAKKPKNRKKGFMPASIAYMRVKKREKAGATAPASPDFKSYNRLNTALFAYRVCPAR